MKRHRIIRESIPEEIVESHILPRLSSKSLVRFTCVCKSWHSLIHHPAFRRPIHHNIVFLSRDSQYLTVATSQPHVFSAPFDPTVQPNTTTTPPRATPLFILPTNLDFSETRFQCVNGLLCFHPNNRPFYSSPDSAFTLIANPTTRQFLTLPLDHSIVKEFRVSTHFGYDPIGDEFKVLRLVEYPYENSHEFKVFTLGRDRSWRVITPHTPSEYDVIHFLLYGHMRKRGLYVNGAIHWKIRSKIVAFDVATERFRMMHPPSTYCYGNISDIDFLFQPVPLPDTVEIGGCLCLVGYDISDYKLWILKDYEAQEWEQKTIVLTSGFERNVYPHCGVPTGEILFLPNSLPNCVRGIYYDMKKMSSTRAEVVEMPLPLSSYKGSGELDIFLCEESFRLLN